MENKLTRANKLSICLTVFYAVIALVTAFGLDATYSVFARTNPIAALGALFGFPAVAATPIMWLMLIFILVYIVLFDMAVCYIMYWLRRHGEKLYSKKAWLYYSIAFAAAVVLSLGLGTLFHLSVGMDSYPTTMIFVSQVLVMAALFFVILALAVYAIIGIAVYCIGFAKVNLTSYNEEQVQKEKKEAEEFEKEINGEDNAATVNDEEDVSSSFGEIKKAETISSSESANASPVVSGTNALSSEVTLKPSEEEVVLPEKEKLFPALNAIDEEYAASNFVAMDNPGITLPSLIDDLQAYLASKEHLFYEKKELALFVAAMNATHLIILEGISGTGKSSLPRYFSKFIGEEAFFEPIQVTYKEKSDLLGYYNEFTRKYMETPFLRRLYQATYTADRLNLMVLDEMNISRVEYYFADFLSVLEFPEDERRVSLLTLPEDYDSPRHLRDGQMDLLPNTYFIGTCNKDDSTYTVTDKVIDRAVIIDFETYQREIAVDRDVSPILLSYAGLSDLFRKAEEDSDLRFSEEDRSRFLDLLAFMEEEFAIALGNRLLRQVEKMTPVYQAIGRKKDELLDYLFATKVLRKLQGRMDSSLTLSLRRLSDKIDSLYGKEAFLLSRKQIERTIQRLGL